MPKVALIMGSKSDWPSLRGCVDVLKGFEIEVEVHVASAHRTPETVAAFAANARENGFEAIIAAAGKAAHLAGVIAGHTTLPVIGIPVKSSFMDGLDSLLSTVQMPTGIRWRRWPSAAATTRRIWRRRCSPSNTRFSPKSCWRIASGWRRRSRRTTNRFRKNCKAEAA